MGYGAAMRPAILNFGDQRDWIPLPELCDRASITMSGFRWLRSRGRTPPTYRVGRRTFVRRTDAENWLSARMKETA